MVDIKKYTNNIHSISDLQIKFIYNRQLKLLMQFVKGEMAERFKAAVLKTVEGRPPSQGSNPCLSAMDYYLHGDKICLR